MVMKLLHMRLLGFMLEINLVDQRIRNFFYISVGIVSNCFSKRLYEFMPLSSVYSYLFHFS